MVQWDMTSMTKSLPFESVLRVLDKTPKLMSSSVVFGSAVSTPYQANDLDVAFVIPRKYEFGDLDKYRRLLKAGALGTPRYGQFDLFLLFDDCMWVRNGDCLGFERAKNSKSIRKTIISEAQPWGSWRNKFGHIFASIEALPSARISP